MTSDDQFYRKWYITRYKGKKRYMWRTGAIQAALFFAVLTVFAGFIEHGSITVEYFTSGDVLSYGMFFAVIAPVYGWSAARSAWYRNEQRFDDLEKIRED
ncbi:hypothetical protein [Alteribacter natronophilus]|uniref:hypothetical protein n=1 Tax=Alteribacter natronophilus TaxID=2583810 RepID=UPI00110F5B36|nr:hypothetical protein [Alteribacter natronophilus]TMW73437.1 hypothetical protein FGB90_03810 [Alteribacter natronophilus]